MRSEQVRKYHVKCSEPNIHYIFDDFDKMIAYCKELDFQGYTFTVYFSWGYE